MYVDQSWNQDQPLTPLDLHSFGTLEVGADGSNRALDNEQIQDLVDGLRGIDDSALAKEERTRTHSTPPFFAASAPSGAPPARR